MSSRGVLHLAAGIVLAGAVAAQPSPASLPPAAEQALRRGVLAAQQEAWGLAIRYFTETQQLAPASPEVLFNLGLTHAKAGQEILGILWFRAYLSAAPSAPNAQQVREEIDRLEVGLEASVQKLFDEANLTAQQLQDLDKRKRAVDSVSDYQKRAANLSSDDADGFLKFIARVQIRNGGVDGARRLAEDMLPFPKRQVLGELARTLAEEHNFHALKQILAHVDESEAAHLVSTLGEAGEFRLADEIVSGLKNPHYRAVGKLNIAEFRMSAGETAEARKIASEILEAKRNGENIGEFALVKALVFVGDVAGALKIIEEIKPGPLGGEADVWTGKNLALGTLAAAQVVVGDLTGALATAQKAKQQGFFPEAPMGRVYAMKAKALAKKGDIAGARQIIQKMEAGLWKESALVNLAEVQARAGDIAGALKIADELKEIGDKSPYINVKEIAARSRDSALLAICREQVGRRDLVGAEPTVWGLSDDAYRVKALLSLAEAHQKQANLSEGKRLLKETRRVATRSGQVSVLRMIEQQLGKEGTKPDAQQVAVEATVAGWVELMLYLKERESRVRHPVVERLAVTLQKIRQEQSAEDAPSSLASVGNSLAQILHLVRAQDSRLHKTRK